jgi:hypothetical protein
MALLSSQDPSNPRERQEQISYVQEAFKLQYNWIALAGVGAFALISGSFLPIILAGGLELMYLATVPHNDRFQRLVRSWKFAEQQKKKQQQLGAMLRTLPSEMQSRYVHCVQICNAIRSNFAQFSATSQIFLHQIDARLQGLLSGYARLLLAAAQQQQYLRSTDPEEFKREIASLERTMANDPPKVQEINTTRIEILSKRQEKFDKISENRRVVDAQLSAVEDVLMLARDQSVTMRDPQQVSDRLDNLVRDVEQTEQTVQQVEAIFSDLSPDLDGLMSLDDTPPSSSSGTARTRISN